MSFCKANDRTIDNVTQDFEINLAKWNLFLLINYINLHYDFSLLTYQLFNNSALFCIFLCESSSIAPHVLIQKIILHNLFPIGSIIIIEPHTKRNLNQAMGPHIQIKAKLGIPHSFTLEKTKMVSIRMTNPTIINLYPHANICFRSFPLSINTFRFRSKLGQNMCLMQIIPTSSET